MLEKLVQFSFQNVSRETTSFDSGAAVMYEELTKEVSSLKTQIESMKVKETEKVDALQKEIVELRIQMSNSQNSEIESVQEKKEINSFQEHNESNQSLDGRNEDVDGAAISKNSVAKLKRKFSLKTIMENSKLSRESRVKRKNDLSCTENKVIKNSEEEEDNVKQKQAPETTAAPLSEIEQENNEKFDTAKNEE